MNRTRRWLFGVVARSFTHEGFRHANLDLLVGAETSPDLHLAKRYPTTHALALALIDEICEALFEAYSERTETEENPYERLVAFFINGLDFVATHPVLGQVIIGAIFGSDRLLQDHVHTAFRAIVELISDDLLRAMIIPDRSPLLIADVTSNLVSLLFTGGAPMLDMQYLSFVDHRNVGISALEALKRRYEAGRHLAPMQ